MTPQNLGSTKPSPSWDQARPLSHSLTPSLPHSLTLPLSHSLFPVNPKGPYSTVWQATRSSLLRSSPPRRLRAPPCHTVDYGSSSKVNLPHAIHFMASCGQIWSRCPPILKGTELVHSTVWLLVVSWLRTSLSRDPMVCEPVDGLETAQPPYNCQPRRYDRKDFGGFLRRGQRKSA